ncbi:MAG: hypothetical protein IPM17_14715 [Verrucomicrobia bacterium]|jgi:hypothetical protein|nr:hypothetical protein [Verrucomicrobiota bacterium]
MSASARIGKHLAAVGWMAGWLLAGCSSISDHTIQYVGAPRPPRTDPYQVELLREEPKRPFDRLGEVVVESSLNPPPAIEKIEGRLRAGAARLGADAVFLATDQTQVTGTQFWGPYWAPSATATQNRVIVGVAIKYR